jgi:hypothetical protein
MQVGTKDHNPRPWKMLCLGVTTAIVVFAILGIQWSLTAVYNHRQLSITCKAVSSNENHEMTFRRRMDFWAFTAAGDTLWQAIIPDNGGLLVQRDGDGRPVEVKGVSMFHQLHCLQIIREGLRASIVGQSELVAHTGAHGGHTADARHIPHCLDYLMQAITCNADATLESANANGDINGFEVAHQCGDASRLWDLVNDTSRRDLT